VNLWSVAFFFVVALGVKRVVRWHYSNVIFSLVLWGKKEVFMMRDYLV